MNDHNEPPRIEVVVAAATETVWQALRDPDLIRRWHGWHYEGGGTGSGGLDDEIQVIYATGVIEDPAARLLELADGTRISLHPAAGGTLVRLVRAPHGVNPEWDASYDDVTEGWWSFLQQLRFALERHALAERRTMMLQAAKPDGGALLIEAVGLATVADLTPGSPYEARLATGEDVCGSVWARSPRQLALTLDGDIDGLLILAEQPHTAGRPDGGAMVLLSAYGLDDADFAVVERRWSHWWSRYGAIG